MVTKDIKFSCDGLTLTGTLHLPQPKNPPLVIGCHGLFADRNSPSKSLWPAAATRLASLICVSTTADAVRARVYLMK